MASAQVVETSVTNDSPSQDSNHPDDLFQARYVTPGFKPFSYNIYDYDIMDVFIIITDNKSLPSVQLNHSQAVFFRPQEVLLLLEPLEAC